MWGTEPGASFRVAAGTEPMGELTVRVLGNPVAGDAVAVDVEGAQGQPLRVRLLDSQGREVSRQQRTSAEIIERLRLDVGSQPAGLLLQISTPTRSQTLKVLRQ